MSSSQRCGLSILSRVCAVARQTVAVLCFVATATAVEPVDFGRDIRPILSENCFYCHGQDGNQRQADLRLDDREAAVGYGAIVPSDADASLLIERILTDEPDLQMPPADSNRQLSKEQKEHLVRWIEQGAVYSNHWAYVAPVRPELPEVRHNEWIRNPIDRFVLAELQQRDWTPSPEADRATLIKRLSIDLVGLPPTPEEVDAFVTDESSDAYEKLVDRLMASPHYGERMALPWLDAARYADSNGFQQDGDHWQWIWRDWVVRALNSDLPFDKFTIWQLAGDLLPDASTDQLVASAFNRNHMLNGEGGAIAEEQRFVILFDRVDTTATTWMGLTMACAQCHDHKYDPITKRDYYRLLDAFNRVPENGAVQFISPRIRVAPPFRELPTEENKDRIALFNREIADAQAKAKLVADAAFEGWRAGYLADGAVVEKLNVPETLLVLLEKPATECTPEEKQALEIGLRVHFDNLVKPTLAEKLPALAMPDRLRKQLDSYKKDQVPRLMVMSDAQPRDTHILDRGEYTKPGEKVSFDTPEFLPPLPEGAAKNRLGLAQWLVYAEQPLTARVQVNRMWQHFFGTGIVNTSEDFGVQSEYPVHKALLDWLAVEFREQGWSMKHLNRLIVTSATYRQSSRLTADHRTHDLQNRLYARASRFRMTSLLLRDWALAASGLLHSEVGGPPVYPYQPGDVWESLAITKERDFTYPTSAGDDLYRRSIYTFWRRTVAPANMFNSSSRQACRVRLETTSTPLHALTTLNDPTWVEAARVLAERSIQNMPSLDEQLERAFRQVLCRPPTEIDQQRLREAYDHQLAIYRADEAAAEKLLGVGRSPRVESLGLPEHAAMTTVCLMILNMDEALTRE